MKNPETIKSRKRGLSKAARKMLQEMRRGPWSNDFAAFLYCFACIEPLLDTCATFSCNLLSGERLDLLGTKGIFLQNTKNSLIGNFKSQFKSRTLSSGFQLFGNLYSRKWTGTE